MKNFIIISLLLLVELHGFGQEEAPDNNPLKKWRIGVNLNPEYNFRSLTTNSNEEVYDVIIDFRNEYEKPKVSVAFGLETEYVFNKRISLSLGVNYSNKGYKTETTNLIFGDVIDQRRGFIITTDPNDPAIPQEFNYVYNYYYLGIPIKLHIKFGGKLKLRTSVGLTSGILLKSNQTNIYKTLSGETKTTTNTIGSFNRFNLFPTIGLGAELELKERHFLFIEPTTQYGVFNIIDAPISAKFWNLGITLGYHFAIK